MSRGTIVVFFLIDYTRLLLLFWPPAQTFDVYIQINRNSFWPLGVIWFVPIFLGVEIDKSESVSACRTQNGSGIVRNANIT